MKKLLTVIFSLALWPCVAAPVTFENAPLTGDDVAEVLGLNIQKYKLTFDSPKKIVVEITHEQGNKQDIEIKGISSTATLRIFYPVPSKDGEVVKVDFKITTGSGNGVTSAFSMDSAKLKSTTAHPVGNDFIVVGLNEKDTADKKDDSDSPVFKLRIVTSN